MQTILESGELVKRSGSGSSEKLAFRMELLQARHLPDIMALQELIIARLSRPDLLEPFSVKFMEKHVQSQGRIFGILVAEELIAFRNIYFPTPIDLEWNLGIDLNIPGPELPHVANLQMVCVHPAFRGNKLAFKMNDQALGYLKSLAHIQHVCATVSPFNYWNIQVLLDSGFYIRKLKEKYGGKLRFIVYQNLAVPYDQSGRETVTVPLLDFDRQQELIQAGFVGIRIRRTSGLQPDLSCPSPYPAEQVCRECEVVYARL